MCSSDLAGDAVSWAQADGSIGPIVQANLTAPTITSVVAGPVNGTVTCYFTGGSGPYYQIYWYGNNTAPQSPVTPDGSGSSSPISDSTGPSSNITEYMYVRSVATLGETSVGPSSVASAWSAGVSFNMTAYYTVTWDANGGSVSPSSFTQSSGSLSTTAPTPTLTGYSFNGWYSASSGGSLIVSAGNSYTPTSDITLYAQWTANTYTVSYDANGGSGAPSSQTKTYNVTLTLSSTVPTRTGYTFNNWNTASGGGGTSYASGASYTNNASVTLYAQWTQNPSVPGNPSNTSVGSTTQTTNLTTTLIRNSNTNKTQSWNSTGSGSFTISWTGGSGATSHEVYYNTNGATPTSGTGADFSNLGTSYNLNYSYGSASVNYYYWVRARKIGRAHV